MVYVTIPRITATGGRKCVYIQETGGRMYVYIQEKCCRESLSSTMTNSVLFALTLCLVVCYSSALFFNNNCGSTCRPGSCAGSFGCTRCQGNLCVKRINGVGVCVPGCGRGAFCNPVGFCNNCDDSNCEVCRSKYVCDQCKTRYTLQNDRWCVRERRG
ncbi:uncharacterized protein [Haliotis asinina]|uniref:uncharacterized protein n=1 Tax=Haliotis asinina TaxID=109174 RepID=UPI0035326398